MEGTHQQWHGFKIYIWIYAQPVRICRLETDFLLLSYGPCGLPWQTCGPGAFEGCSQLSDSCFSNLASVSVKIHATSPTLYCTILYSQRFWWALSACTFYGEACWEYTLYTLWVLWYSVCATVYFADDSYTLTGVAQRHSQEFVNGLAPRGRALCHILQHQIYTVPTPLDISICTRSSLCGTKHATLAIIKMVLYWWQCMLGYVHEVYFSCKHVRLSRSRFTFVTLQGKLNSGGHI